MTPPRTRNGRGEAVRCGIAVFLAAVLLRVIFILQYGDSPSFHVPVIDSATYDETARMLAFQGEVTPKIFWHGFLYPFFLSAVYRIGGGSIPVARMVQAVLGGFTALLSFALASRVFDRRTGLAAGLITGLYGPLIFFETEILSTGLAAFVATLSVFLALRMEKGRLPAYLAFGVVGGLAVITRGVLFPFVAAVFLWTAFSARSRSLPWKVIAGRESLILAGVAAVLVPAALLSGSVSGHYSPLPRSGSINMYIGNNPDMERTLMIRPGSEWSELLREPTLHGYTGGEGEYRRYFTDRVREYASTHPVEFASGLARKALMFVTSREIPRTYDIYTAGEYSSLLAALVWKARGFGFPFGIVLVLGLYGLVALRRRVPVPVWLYLTLYPASVILVFPAARYRAPLIPVLAAPAAAGLVLLIRKAASGELRFEGRYAAAAIALVIAMTVPGPFDVEDFDYRTELHCCVAYMLSGEDENLAAEAELRKALERDPDDSTANRLLGCVLHELGRQEESIDCFERALESDPGSYVLHYYLGVALMNSGEIERGRKHLHAASEGATRSRDHMITAQVRDVLGSGSVRED